MSDITTVPGLSAELTSVLAELGFDQLTPIQEASLPALLEGRDLVGQSQTGSGKTAAFALPILQKIDLGTRMVQALVLCPTRELGAQVAREIRRLGRKLNGLQVLDLAGGQPFRPQAEALARGVHVVVGTPGRLLDHVNRQTLHLGALQTLVLDEADRMLDMGFLDEVGQVIQATPPARQTVLFSATFPPTIAGLSRRIQRQPVNVKVEEAEAKPEIKQLVFHAETDEKTALLIRILKAYPGTALVFCNQKLTIADIVERLNKEGLPAAALHGDLEQRDRDQVLALFRNGSVQRLIATDIAGRGLDVEHLDLVVNYEVPHEEDVFIHRIGRTGRAGRSGLAITLGHEGERDRLRAYARSNAYEIERGQPSNLIPRSSDRPAVETLLIVAGRKDKLRPGDVLGALTGEGGLPGDGVGKIEVQDHVTYVAVNAAFAKRAFERLRTGKIKGRRFIVKPL